MDEEFGLPRAGVRLPELALALHVGVAFNLGHAWSHADAYDRTARTGGFGPGIFANYFFVALWSAEAAWMWLSFESYLNRPAWLDRLSTGFQWFVLFNAAVVFGHGIVRWFGLLMLTAPWLMVVLERRSIRVTAP